MTTILPLVLFESNSNHRRNKAKPGKNRKHENCLTVYQIIIISYCHILLMHTHKNIWFIALTRHSKHISIVILV